MKETVNGKDTGAFDCSFTIEGNRFSCYTLLGSFINYKGQVFSVDIGGCD